MNDRKEEGKQRILDGAAHILDGGRLGDFTVDSLARNLHMSKSTLYKYFDSKDHVVQALVDAVCRKTMQSLEGLDLSTSHSASEALDAVMGVLAHYADSVPAAILLAAQELPLEASEVVEQTRQAARGRIEPILEQGQRTGEFTLAEPELLSFAYLAALEEGIMASARGVGHLGRSAAVFAVHKMLLRGLVRP